MHIYVLGAGLIGVSTAWFLRQSGHDVTVIERQPDVGLETSFANGGQISVSYSEPLSSIQNLKKAIFWLRKEDAPLLFKYNHSLQQFMWISQFLYECLPPVNRENTKKLITISKYSRNTLNALRQSLNLNYNQNTNGILTFYTNQKSFDYAAKNIRTANKFGAERVLKTANECYQIEPSLEKCLYKIYGGDYTQNDESGDAFLYLQELKKHCQTNGVNFVFNTSINSLIKTNNRISFIKATDGKNNNITYIPDAVIVCLGSYTHHLMKSLKIYAPIYPIKGYSASFDIEDHLLINKISLTSSDSKIVYTKIGNTLRVAGTAEFNGYNIERNPIRENILLNETKEMFPKGLNYGNVKYWNGLRPSTPSNIPIIGKSKISNLFINSGHGTLGWTMAAGSGKIIEQIINNNYNIE